MSGTLTGKNRAFLADTYLSPPVLAALDSGEGVVFYGETINRMLDEARALDPAVAALEAEVARLREVLQHWIEWLVDGAQTGGRLSRASLETLLLMSTLPAPSEMEAG